MTVDKYTLLDGINIFNVTEVFGSIKWNTAVSCSFVDSDSTDSSSTMQVSLQARNPSGEAAQHSGCSKWYYDRVGDEYDGVKLLSRSSEQAQSSARSLVTSWDVVSLWLWDHIWLYGIVLIYLIVCYLLYRQFKDSRRPGFGFSVLNIVLLPSMSVSWIALSTLPNIVVPPLWNVVNSGTLFWWHVVFGTYLRWRTFWSNSGKRVPFEEVPYVVFVYVLTSLIWLSVIVFTQTDFDVFAILFGLYGVGHALFRCVSSLDDVKCP